MSKIFYIEKKQLGGGISKPSGYGLKCPCSICRLDISKTGYFFLIT